MRGDAAKEGLFNIWYVVREQHSLARLLLLHCHPSAARTAAGEGRSVLDPANADFVESIRSGTCPRELDPLDPSKHVSPAVLLPTSSVSCCRLPPISQESKFNGCTDPLGPLRATAAALL